MPSVLQLVGVGRQLQQRGDLRVPRQLGVVHDVGAVTTDQEVGAAVEPAVEERALEDHVRTGLQGGHRLGLRGLQRVTVVRPRHRDLGHATGDARRVVAEAVEVALQHPRLVGLAEMGRPREHRVDLLGQHQPAELGVQPAQQPELAVRRDREIAGAVHHRVVEQEHRCPPFCLPTTLAARSDRVSAATTGPSARSPRRCPRPPSTSATGRAR